MKTIKVKIPTKIYESFKQKGFLKEEELQDEAAKVRKEVGRGGVEHIITSKDKSEVEKAVKDLEKEYPSAGYGTRLKKMYQKGETWIAVVSRGTSAD